MNIAVIDIGTNTVLLLVARFEESGRITPLVYEQQVPRLGKGVDQLRNLQRDAMQRVLNVLKEYQHMMSGLDLAATVVCGTSAVRDARNREEFGALLTSETGWTLETLSGEEEAFWTYRGAISGIPGVSRATVVDIGGGSTEISVGAGGVVKSSISLDIGSVRLTERFFMHDPPTHPELEAAITLVENELARPKGFDFQDTTLVGVAGTATSLAALAQGLHEFRLEAVTNYHLTIDNVYHLFRTLRATPASQIQDLSRVMEGRSDVITAGSLILREIMAHYKFNEMIVSERGVRYGLAIREWEKRRAQ